MEKLFELKKDISIPNRYIRAGEQKTKEEWEKLFPDAFKYGDTEWFIDLSEKMNEFDERTLARDIVNEVFTKFGLHSLSYKDAALVAIRIYVERTSEK